MDLLNGAAALTPPYRKRLHTTHGTTHKLFNHRTKISQLSSVYFELQDQSAVILREIATLVIDPDFVTDVDSEVDPVNESALAFFHLLVKLGDAHSTPTSTTTDVGVPTTTCNTSSTTRANTAGAATDEPVSEPVSVALAADEDLTEQTAAAMEAARTKFTKADGEAIEATQEFVTLSRKKTKDKTRYDAGSKLQDLRKSAHRAALDFGVTLLIAPKVAQFGALRPCIDLIARVCERAIGIAAVCGGDTGVIAAHGKASAALVRCREYTLQFLATQQVALKKLTSRRLALDENAYHDNPDIYVNETVVAGGDTTHRKDVEARSSQLVPDMTGFLFAKKVPGLKAKAWSRWFFAIHDHALLLWHPEVEDWAVFCGLTGAASKEVAASDRSNTFQVTFPKLKHLKLKLQGESRKEVAEWMGAISTASRKLSGALGVHSAPKDGKVAPVYFSASVPQRSLTDERLSGITDTKEGNAMWVPDSAGMLHLVLVNDSDADVEPPHRPDSMLIPDENPPMFDAGTGFSGVTIDGGERRNPFGGGGGGRSSSPAVQMSELLPAHFVASDPLFEDDDVDDSLFAKKLQPKESENKVRPDRPQAPPRKNRESRQTGNATIDHHHQNGP